MDVLKKPWVAGIISASVVILSVVYLFVSSTSSNVEASTSRERRTERDRTNVSQNVRNQENEDNVLIQNYVDRHGLTYVDSIIASTADFDTMFTSLAMEAGQGNEVIFVYVFREDVLTASNTNYIEAFQGGLLGDPSGVTNTAITLRDAIGIEELTVTMHFLDVNGVRVVDLSFRCDGTILDSGRVISSSGTSSVSGRQQTSIESTLVGTWDNGSGRLFLFVFGEADSVEFRDNGTVIITEGGSSRTVNWSSSGPGAFTADRREFTYTISGDVLTITDSFDDSWTFDRVH